MIIDDQHAGFPAWHSFASPWRNRKRRGGHSCADYRAVFGWVQSPLRSHREYRGLRRLSSTTRDHFRVAVSVESVVNRLEADPENACGFSLAAAYRPQSRCNQRSLRIVERHPDANDDAMAVVASRIGGRRNSTLRRRSAVDRHESADVDVDFVIRQNKCAMNDILQLAHVARPRMSDDAASCISAQCLGGSVLLV